MAVKNDFLMNQVYDYARALGLLVFNKSDSRYDIEPEAVRMELTENDFYEQLKAMARDGKINEAENLLLETIDVSDKRNLETALGFYTYINSFSDEELEENNYSREEIVDGLKMAAKKFGVTGMEYII